MIVVDVDIPVYNKQITEQSAFAESRIVIE
jgi:hypothetical protein